MLPLFTAIRTPRTDTFTWSISSPVVGGIPGPRLHKAATVTRIDAYCVAGTSVAFNIEKRSVIGSSGTDLMTGDLTAGTSGANQTGFANSSLAVGDWLWLDISAVTDAVTNVVITITFTVTE